MCQIWPLAVQVDRSNKAPFASLLVTNWGLAVSEDEELSGPGAPDFGLASQVKWLSN